MIVLRNYQESALKALNGYFRSGAKGNPLIEAPTGSGKSIMIGEFVKRMVQTYGARILILTHVKELVEQNEAELRALWPEAPTGINSAGMGRRDTTTQILFAGIQSVAKKAHTLGRFDLILVDEAHLIPKKGEGMYRVFIEDAKKQNAKLRVIGFTATPYRMDGGLLTKGDGRIFTDIAYRIPIPTLIDAGHLCPLIPKKTKAEADLSGVKTARGDFAQKGLEAVMDDSELVRLSVREIVEQGQDRKSWLVFCSGVGHAEHVLEEIRSHGITAEMITGTTEKKARDGFIRGFKKQAFRCLVNVNVLTTGFNAPATDLLACLRPTKSTSLYVQMMGRGMRTSPGKENCVLEGQEVLTNRGLVPIEKVGIEDLLWDGVDWVKHSGAVSKGVQSVIRYAGLTATEDHNVWTEEGWKSFGECSRKQVPIAVTGDGRIPIKESEGYWLNSSQERRAEPALHGHGMPVLREDGAEGLRHSQEGDSWLPEMREAEAGPGVAFEEMRWGAAKVRERRGPKVQGLRRERDRVQVWGTDRDGCLDCRKPGPRPDEADRPDRQQWALREGEPEALVEDSKPVQYAEDTGDGRDARVPDRSPRSAVCGLDLEGVLHERDDVQGYRRAVATAVVQTEGRVWDILNAGPRHRFTVSGLLVSNCRVLDFGGNVERHGPVDCVNPKTVGDGTGPAPVKVCPNCDAQVYTGILECPDCGHIWERELAKHAPKASTSALLSKKEEPVWHDLTSAFAKVHKKQGKPDSIRITFCSGRLIEASVWLCLWHEGFASVKAEQTWKQWFKGYAIPASAALGVQVVTNALAIRGGRFLLGKEKGYDRVMKVEFKESEIPF